MDPTNINSFIDPGSASNSKVAIDMNLQNWEWSNEFRMELVRFWNYQHNQFAHAIVMVDAFFISLSIVLINE
jgi:hypothetical protein